VAPKLFPGEPKIGMAFVDRIRSLSALADRECTYQVCGILNGRPESREALIGYFSLSDASHGVAFHTTPGGYRTLNTCLVFANETLGTTTDE
jgi:hypothetical protein